MKTDRLAGHVRQTAWSIVRTSSSVLDATAARPSRGIGRQAWATLRSVRELRNAVRGRMRQRSGAITGGAPFLLTRGAGGVAAFMSGSGRARAARRHRLFLVLLAGVAVLAASRVVVRAMRARARARGNAGPDLGADHLGRAGDSSEQIATDPEAREP